MQKLSFLLSVILFPFTLNASQLWIVGDDFVGYSKDGHDLKIIKDLPLSSSGFNERQCQIWGTTKNKQLVTVDTELKVNSVDETAEILSDVHDGKFYTRSFQQNIELRNSQGEILSVSFVANAESMTQIHPISLSHPNTYLALHVEPTPNRLWFSVNHENSVIPQNFMVNEGGDLWGKAGLHLDEAHKQIWIGYSKSTPKNSYSPFVERFNLQGQKLNTYQWNEKGLYFDACLNPQGTLLVARDLPSPQFTVPVFSFFELLSPTGPPQKKLALETNLLVDSIVCRGHQVHYLTHSILSGSKSTVFEWSPGTNNGPTALFQLPSSATKLYSCPAK